MRVIEKLLAELKILKGGAIGLLGLASKPRRIIWGRRRPLQSPVNLRNAVSRWKAQDPVALARARRELPDAGIAFCEDAGQVVKGEGAWSRPPNGLGTATCRGNLTPAKCATP